MPPKALFSSEEILEKALDVVRLEGMEALTARRLASELGCTPRPIYHAFDNMNDLKDSVLRKAGQYAIQFILQTEAESPALALQLGYLKFAQMEKELFQIVYMSSESHVDYHQDRVRPLFDKLKRDSRLKNMDDMQITSLNTNLWIYAHGLSTLISVGAIMEDNQQLISRLKNMISLFISNELSVQS